MSAPVVVALDTAPDAAPDAAGPAVRRAAREAARRAAPLRILLPAGGAPDARRASLVHALATARRAAPRTVVTAVLDDEQPGRALRMATAEAALLVVPAASEHVDDLVVSAHCPLLVVPAADGDPAGPVLLGAGPATPSEVVAFAFAQAQDRGAELIAVRTWHDPLVDLGLLTGDRIARWDAADATVRHELADQLALAVLAHPDVQVTTRVVDDGCTPLLAALATRARLLVVGRPARGAALGRLRPSPALTLARHAPCPVVVVPPEGPTGQTLLPRRPVGRADLRV